MAHISKEKNVVGNWKFCLLGMVLLTTMELNAQQVSVAATPPMGWNSWNHFAEKVTEADVRSAADALVASGMRDAGYVYVNIDDTWEGKRDAQGVIVLDSNAELRIPSHAVMLA